jgi:hypothetical protein
MTYGVWALFTVVSYLTWFRPTDLGQWIALLLLGPVIALSVVSLGVMLFILVAIPYHILRSIAIFLWWVLRFLYKVRNQELKDIVKQVSAIAEREDRP